MAFVAKKDEIVGTFFQEIWDEGSNAARLGMRAMPFGASVQEAILPHLTKALINALEDVSWSRRRIACAALSELSETNVLAPAPRTLDTNISNSEELMARLSVKSISSAKILNSCVKLIVNTRIWTGKAELLKTVTKILSNWVVLNSNDANLEDSPVSFSASKDDLFAGDSWFVSGDYHHQEECLENPKESPMETTADSEKEEESAEINFDEGDKMLAVSDQVENNIEFGSKALAHSAISLYGLCRLLLDQGLPMNVEAIVSSDYLLYRSAAIESLTSILECMDVIDFSKQLQDMHELVSPRILPFMKEAKVDGQDIPPLITAKCFKCYSSIIYSDIGRDSQRGLDPPDLLDLSELFRNNCGPMQAAWTVREGAGLAAAKLVTKGLYSSVQKIAVIDNLIECTKALLKDRKFWKVRLAGLKIILSFCSRTSTQSSSRNMAMGSSNKERNSIEKERQVLFEAILPYKEIFISISRSCMTDNEAKVTAAASEIMSSISWWP